MGRRSSAAPRSDNSGKAEAEADPSPKPRPAPKRAPAADDSWGTERTGEMRRDRGGDWEFRGSARLASAKNAESGCALRASVSCPRLLKLSIRCGLWTRHSGRTTAKAKREVWNFGYAYHQGKNHPGFHQRSCSPWLVGLDCVVSAPVVGCMHCIAGWAVEGGVRKTLGDRIASPNEHE